MRMRALFPHSIFRFVASLFLAGLTMAVVVQSGWPGMASEPHPRWWRWVRCRTLWSPPTLPNRPFWNAAATASPLTRSPRRDWRTTLTSSTACTRRRSTTGRSSRRRPPTAALSATRPTTARWARTRPGPTCPTRTEATAAGCRGTPGWRRKVSSLIGLAGGIACISQSFEARQVSFVPTRPQILTAAWNEVHAAVSGSALESPHIAEGWRRRGDTCFWGPLAPTDFFFLEVSP